LLSPPNSTTLPPARLGFEPAVRACLEVGLGVIAACW
jgi:hypothetical protein